MAEFYTKPMTVLRFLGILYGVAVALLCIPYVQKHVLYLHAVNIPLFAQFDVPQKYGLAPGKTLNLKITTSDNVTLGAWFVLSDTFYHSLSFLPPSSTVQSSLPSALASHPTILFFHGNGATRAMPTRVNHYKAFSSRLGANVLAIDYRGFGDSEGSPSETGLGRDARAAFDWLTNNGAKSEDILLVGHSLGTGVGTDLAAQLTRDDIDFRGLVLLSPFSSLRTLLDTYMIFGFFPLMTPLSMIPGAPNLITRLLCHKFDTLTVISELKASILVVHAENDWEVPISHSESLFDGLLSPLLPPFHPYSKTPTQEELRQIAIKTEERRERRKELVVRADIANFGTLDEFNLGERRVVLLKTLGGGHNRVGELEGVQEVIRDIFRFHAP